MTCKHKLVLTTHHTVMCMDAGCDFELEYEAWTGFVADGLELPEVRRQLSTAAARAEAAEADAERLAAACLYPRYRTTALLLEKAADMIDARVPEGSFSFFTPHLRRAADGMRAALAAHDAAAGDGGSGGNEGEA